MDSAVAGLPWAGESNFFQKRPRWVWTLRISIYIQMLLAISVLLTPYYHEIFVASTVPLIGLYGSHGTMHHFKLIFVAFVNVPSFLAESTKAFYLGRHYYRPMDIEQLHRYHHDLVQRRMEEEEYARHQNETGEFSPPVGELAGIPVVLKLDAPKRLRGWRPAFTLAPEPGGVAAGAESAGDKVAPAARHGPVGANATVEERRFLRQHLSEDVSPAVSPARLAVNLDLPDDLTLHATQVSAVSVWDLSLYIARAVVAAAVAAVSFRLVLLRTQVPDPFELDEDDDGSESVRIDAAHPAVIAALARTRDEADDNQEDSTQLLDEMTLHRGNIGTFARHIGVAASSPSSSGEPAVAMEPYTGIKLRLDLQRTKSGGGDARNSPDGRETG